MQKLFSIKIIILFNSAFLKLFIKKVKECMLHILDIRVFHHDKKNICIKRWKTVASKNLGCVKELVVYGN